MHQIVEPAAFLRARFGPNSTISYMPNGGNLGDNLIAAATIQEFDRQGLNWRFARGGIENVRSSDVLVYGGGGSLVGLYQGGTASLRFLATLRKPIVVLPQTIRNHTEFWSEAPPMTVFCRDRTSYDYMQQYRQIEVLLAHDMATNLDLNTSPYIGVQAYRRNFIGRSVSEFTLSAFRKDSEAKANDKSDASIDLSELATPSFKDSAEIKALAVLFLMSIASATRIRTDRLHVAVGAGLQGIPTDFYDNNYGKNRDVYLHTLQQRFPSVELLLQ